VQAAVPSGLSPPARLHCSNCNAIGRRAAFVLKLDYPGKNAPYASAPSAPPISGPATGTQA
jgi:hypothetical protein